LTHILTAVVVAKSDGKRETGAMPQLQLPMFPEGLTPINEDVAFQKAEGEVVYFHGLMPIFHHAENDLKSFRMFTSQLIDGGTVRHRDIVNAFHVPLATVKRYVKLHRQKGTAGFFQTPRRRTGNVLTPEMRQRVQGLLDEGKSRTEVSRMVGVARDTVRKAIVDGRLHELKKN
jgi:hypothetical protein